MENTSDSAQPAEKIKRPRRTWRARLVGYIKRKLHKRRTQKKAESPTDRAARRTANATIWMAIFTVILAGVSGGTLFILKGQLYEMHGGGIDTHNLADATGKMKDAAEKSAQASRDFADTAKDINGNMDDAVEKLNAQAEASKKLAGQALAQANATRNLAQTSKDALESVQRAFVFTSTGHGDPPVMSDGPPTTVSIAVPFENSGSTPTQNLTAHINWIAMPPGVGEDYFGDMLVNGAVPADTDAVLGPHSAGSTLNVVLPRDTFIQATKGQTSVRIWGWIKYRDIFKDTPRRLTEYCYHLRFSGKIVNDIPATYTLENCPTHNCSDEQCKDYKQRIAN